MGHFPTIISREDYPSGTPRASRPKATHRGWLRWALVVLIFALCAFFLDLGDVADTLRAVPIHWLLFILLLMTMDRLMMAWKWSALLRALGVKVPFTMLGRFYYQGTFTGIFLPSGLGGDLLRAYWVSRSTGATYQVYASLIMEKMIGFLSAVNWALIGIAVFIYSRSHEVSIDWLGGALAGALLINGLFLLSLQPRCHAFVMWYLAGFPRFRCLGFFQRLYEAYSHYGKHRSALAWNGVYTVIEHGLQLLIALTMARSLGIDVSTVLFLSVTAVHLLIYRLPISPDGWGVGEVSAIGLYGLIGLPPESGFALAFLAHVLQTVVVLPGFWFLWKSGIVM